MARTTPVTLVTPLDPLPFAMLLAQAGQHDDHDGSVVPAAPGPLVGPGAHGREGAP